MPDVFDEILAILHPDQLLRDPQSAGQGVRVAVIDSGFDRAALAAKHGGHVNDFPGVVYPGGQSDAIADQGKVSSPHGTTVADVLLTLAPKVQLYSIDVFGPDANCTAETVVKAVRHAMDAWHCQIINLSLGIPESRPQSGSRRNQLQTAIEEAYYRDVLVFAAAHNDHPLTRSFPAEFAPPLMSVDKGQFNQPWDFAYQLNEHVEFQAGGRAYLGPFAHEPATSWAAPHLAGVAARLLSLRSGLKPFEVKTLLYWMSLARQRKTS